MSKRPKGPLGPFANGGANDLTFVPAPEVYRYGSITLAPGYDLEHHMSHPEGELRTAGEAGWLVCDTIPQEDGSLVVILSRKLILPPKMPSSLISPDGKRL